MSWATRPVCVRCWVKLKGPLSEEHRAVLARTVVGPGERWAPCTLCEGSLDDKPGILMRLWQEPATPAQLDAVTFPEKP